MAAHDLTIAIEPLNGDTAALAAAWRALEVRADRSFFLSWDWIGCWLKTAQPEALLLSAHQGGQIVALALLSPARLRRHCVIRPRALLLHQTGDTAQDAISIEYNGILVDRTVAAEAIAACLDFLCNARAPSLPPWDELHGAGVTAEFADAARRTGLHAHIIAQSGSWRVDLDAVRASGRRYLDQLSPNTRQQIRRAMRLYAAHGPLVATAPRSAAEAAQFFTELTLLSRRTWERRGQRNEFALPVVQRFHANLIAAASLRGGVEILRIAAGEHLLGYLYNFVDRGHVYNYQSGFAYADDPRLKPGLVAHVLAIERHLAAGAHVYDFMAGTQRYKRSLGRAGPEIVHIALQRRTPLLRAENALRRIKGALKPRLG